MFTEKIEGCGSPSSWYLTLTQTQTQTIQSTKAKMKLRSGRKLPVTMPTSPHPKNVTTNFPTPTAPQPFRIDLSKMRRRPISDPLMFPPFNQSPPTSRDEELMALRKENAQLKEAILRKNVELTTAAINIDRLNRLYPSDDMYRSCRMMPYGSD